MRKWCVGKWGGRVGIVFRLWQAPKPLEPHCALGAPWPAWGKTLAAGVGVSQAVKAFA